MMLDCIKAEALMSYPSETKMRWWRSSANLSAIMASSFRDFANTPLQRQGRSSSPAAI